MTIRKKKKSKKFRGSHTHGWGAKKKHRGAGNRGGRGMAGSGKRADQKKPSILKEYGPSYFGKHGFHRPQKKIKKDKIINLEYINKNAEKLGKKEGDSFIIDLKKLGYTKVLSQGKVTKKLNITCDTFSKKAEEKIKKASGEAIKCQSSKAS